MVTQEKRSLEMTAVYMQHFEKYKFLCEYHIDTGSHNEVLRDSIENVKTNGVYINVKELLVGIFASSDGPVFVKNDEMFVLKKGNNNIVITDVDSERKGFILEFCGKEVVSLKYPKQKFIDYDPWSTEEDVDFFLWLNKNHNKETFYDDFTI